MIIHKKMLCFATACSLLVGVSFNISVDSSEKTLSEVKNIYENYKGLNSVIEQYEII
jgi:phosphoribosylformylglycinamidine (FGAM) synthase PurS component